MYIADLVEFSLLVETWQCITCTCRYAAEKLLEPSGVVLHSLIAGAREGKQAAVAQNSLSFAHAERARPSATIKCVVI
jgi:hypothetical protein